MKTSFNKALPAKTVAKVATLAPVKTRVVQVDEPELVETDGAGNGEVASKALSTFVGSAPVDKSDIVIPDLKVVQGIGQLSEDFEAGQIVLNKEAVIYDPNGEDTKPLHLTVLSKEKFFVESVEYGSDELPRRFPTAEAAHEAGLTTEWINDEKPGAVPQLKARVLVEIPESVEYSALTEEFEGKIYGLAIWIIQGTAYNKAGKEIQTASTTRLRNATIDGQLVSQIHVGDFLLSTTKIKGKKNTYFAPVLRNGKKHTPEFLAFVEEIQDRFGIERNVSV